MTKFYLKEQTASLYPRLYPFHWHCFIILKLQTTFTNKSHKTKAPLSHEASSVIIINDNLNEVTRFHDSLAGWLGVIITEISIYQFIYLESEKRLDIVIHKSSLGLFVLQLSGFYCMSIFLRETFSSTTKKKFIGTDPTSSHNWTFYPSEGEKFVNYANHGDWKFFSRENEVKTTEFVFKLWHSWNYLRWQWSFGL